MGLHMESPSPIIGSMHWSAHLQLGMEDSFVTDPIDDLSRLVATSTSRTHLHDNATASFGDVGSSSQLNWFAQKRKASEIDCAETPLDYGRTSSLKHAKVNSWNISFGHPHSYTETTPSVCGRTRKRSSVYEEQKLDEGILMCAENELYQNVESTLYQSDIQDLVAFGGKGQHVADSLHSSITIASTKECPDSSSSPNPKEELFSFNHKFGKDAYALSKNELHIMAERRRREKLNQKFIALSAIVPGLKKVDKATILADAVNYVKQLEEQLKMLEDRVPKTVKSVAVHKSDESSYNRPGKSLGNKEEKVEGVQQPDIEARVVGKNVLIRVHCGKIESVLVKALGELENLHLSVVNANVLSFSNTALDLTFTAKIEEDNTLTADDIVKALHIFFRELK